MSEGSSEVSPTPEVSVEESLKVIGAAVNELFSVLVPANIDFENTRALQYLQARQGTCEYSAVYFGNLNNVLSQVAIALGRYKNNIAPQTVVALQKVHTEILSYVASLLQKPFTPQQQELKNALIKLQNGGLDALGGFLKKRNT